MKIHFWGIVWNEAPWLPYFFRHYTPFVERYVFYDNGSDDGTQELLLARPDVELRAFEAEEDSIVETARNLKTNVWKESRGQADLVLVCDVDELVWHRNLSGFLAVQVAAGRTIFRPAGWQMVHHTFPTTAGPVHDEVYRGFRESGYDKPCLFDPNRIQDVNFSLGCHTAAPSGDVSWCADDELRLLHFKYLGVPYVTARYAALDARRGARDRLEKWGGQYATSNEQIQLRFDQFELTELSFASDKS